MTPKPETPTLGIPNEPDTMYWLYDILVGVGLAVAWPLARIRSSWREGFSERLGRWPEAVVAKLHKRPVVWLHCASVGEVNAARPLITRLVERHPEYAFLLTTTTVTGLAHAREGFDDAVVAALLPIDSGLVLRPLFRKLRPSTLIIFETELWPQLLRTARRAGTRIILANGRISHRSFGRYKAIRPLMKSMLKAFDMLLMSGPESAERIRRLGAPPERIRVVGNVKWGAAVRAEGPVDLDLGSSRAPVLVAGSTHAGEEELLLDAFARIRSDCPGARLILAPRHLKRLEGVEALLRTRGMDYVKRSAMQRAEPVGVAHVLLLDTMGELTGVYPHGTVAFLGGSLVPVGGHNMLEPAAAGVPTLYGPHVENFAEIAGLLEASGAAIRVADADELAEKTLALFSDPGHCEQMAAAARQTVKEQSVVLDHYLEVLEQVLT